MYRSIESKFWTDPKIRELSPPQKLVFLYLITCSHSHVAGIYYMPKVLMQHETGLSASEIDKAIDTLSKVYLILYDHMTEVVWVIHMLRYQHHGEKIRLAVASQLESLHKCPLIREFLEEYKDIHIPYQYPIDTRAPVYKEQEQEQDQYQEQENTFVDSSESTTPHRMEAGELIETWNRVCPEHGLPRKTKITQKLRDQIKRRLTHNPEPDFWIAVIETIPTRPFLLGQNKDGWQATFDWLVKNDENAVKVYEGHYSNGARASPRNRNEVDPQTQQWLERQAARKQIGSDGP
jgi:hypothetical protein